MFSYKSGNVFRCSEAWDWKADNFKDYDIWLVCAGTGTLTTKDRTYPITRGDCFVFFPGSSHHASHSRSAPLTVVAAHFDIALVPEAPVFAYHRKLRKTEFIAEMLTRSATFGRRGDTAKANFWLNSALQAVLEHDMESDSAPDNYHFGVIERLYRSIEQAPGKEYKIRDLAKRCGLCHDHFSRLFKELKGQSPQDYIINCRVEQAKDMLMESSISMTGIAEELGYSSVYFFSRQFKQRTGITPSEFRKS